MISDIVELTGVCFAECQKCQFLVIDLFGMTEKFDLIADSEIENFEFVNLIVDLEIENFEFVIVHFEKIDYF